MNNAPPFADAWVVAQDPDNYAVFVSLDGPYGGAGPTYSVKVGVQGPCDGVAGKFPALPTQGTHGRVSFSRGDYRNGVWLCSIITQLTDASAHTPGTGGADYAAHWGGGVSWRAQDGSIGELLPDGSQLVLGPTVMAPMRHTVDQAQVRQRTPFAQAQRVAQTPAAFPLTFTSPNGSSLSMTSSGSWSIVAASGQAVVLSVVGGATFTVSGNTLTVGSDTQVSIASSVAINLTAPAITAGNGGTVQGVKLADNSTATVLKAQ